MHQNTIENISAPSARIINNGRDERSTENGSEILESNANVTFQMSNEQYENYPADEISLLLLEQALLSPPCRRSRFHTVPDDLLLSFQEGSAATHQANSSDHITTAPRIQWIQLILRSNRTRRILCFFRILVVLATVIVYLFLEDTASKAAGPLPPQDLPLFAKSNPVSMYQLNHAQSWESPKFKEMDRAALSEHESFSILKFWCKSHLSWIWSFLIIGVVAEWLWSNMTLRRAFTGINDRAL